MVYPQWTWIGRLLPSLAIALSRRAFRHLALDSPRVIQAGSRGDADVRAERRGHLAADPSAEG